MSEDILGFLKYSRDGREHVLPLDKSELSIGRELHCDIRILNDSKVSRRHCRVFAENDNFFLEDQGSSNGTLVNGKRVKGRIQLLGEESIDVGGCSITFYLDQLSAIPTVRVTRGIIFCEKCSGSIPQYELNRNLAQESDQGYTCADCSSHDAMTGVVIGNYRIERKIAQGGMGVIYKASHTVLSSVVTLKLIREGPTANPALVKRFLREVKLGSRVKHPNIIAFRDAGEHDEIKFIVMEFCDGISLKDALADDKVLDLERFKHIAGQVFDAIEAVHAAELVHRDINPSNILITSDDTVKLIDFGLVKNLDPEGSTIITQSGSGMGTPHYLAPEEGRDAAHIDARCDIYSLGATFYRLLCGRPPVGGKNMREFMINLARLEIKHPCDLCPELPRELGDCLMKSLSEEPSERFPDILAFREALLAAC
ncbi:protein kinase [Planctomycetota bacterium]